MLETRSCTWPATRSAVESESGGMTETKILVFATLNLLLLVDRPCDTYSGINASKRSG